MVFVIELDDREVIRAFEHQLLDRFGAGATQGIRKASRIERETGEFLECVENQKRRRIGPDKGDRPSSAENFRIATESFFGGLLLIVGHGPRRREIVETADRNHSSESARLQSLPFQITPIERHQRRQMAAGGMAGQIDALGVEAVFAAPLDQMADRGGDVFSLRRVTMRRRQPIAHQRHGDSVMGQILTAIEGPMRYSSSERSQKPPRTKISSGGLTADRGR